jgi:hypothetical protein
MLKSYMTSGSTPIKNNSRSVNVSPIKPFTQHNATMQQSMNP